MINELGHYTSPKKIKHIFEKRELLLTQRALSRDLYENYCFPVHGKTKEEVAEFNKLIGESIFQLSFCHDDVQFEEEQKVYNHPAMYDRFGGICLVFDYKKIVENCSSFNVLHNKTIYCFEPHKYTFEMKDFDSDTSKVLNSSLFRKYYEYQFEYEYKLIVFMENGKVLYPYFPIKEAIKYAVLWIPQNFKKCEISWKSDRIHKDECKWEHTLCQEDYVDAVVTLRENKIPIFSYYLGKDIAPLEECEDIRR